MQQISPALWILGAMALIISIAFGIRHSTYIPEDRTNIQLSTTTQVLVHAVASRSDAFGANPSTEIPPGKMASAPRSRTQVMPKKFPVWKTVTLGTYKDLNSLRAALKEKEINYFEAASWMLDSPAFSMSATQTKIDLVSVTVADLGFADNAPTVDEAYTRALELGLELCPAEVGPQLLLQHEDAATVNVLTIAMRFISIEHYPKLVFGISRSEGGALFLNGGGPGTFFDPEEKEPVVFCSSPSSPSHSNL